VVDFGEVLEFYKMEFFSKKQGICDKIFAKNNHWINISVFFLDYVVSNHCRGFPDRFQLNCPQFCTGPLKVGSVDDGPVATRSSKTIEIGKIW
jgi:hypothetical protein